MGRIQTVTFECDWCTAVTEPEGHGGAPDSWAELGNELLCGECYVARKSALSAARAARRPAVRQGEEKP